ncbi:MAG: methyltransferase domain-containing protein [Desulfobacterales bacterium]
MKSFDYLMDSNKETLRLDVKTDPDTVIKQATWAGLKKGMRVADMGFGSGKTSYALHKLTGADGEVVGLDFAEDRISFARKHYKKDGIDFLCKDIRKPIEDVGTFDFIYVRFVLEYYRSESFDIVKNISDVLSPNGILTLIDLDHNCLNHYGLSKKLEMTLFDIMEVLQKEANFDPYAGRKLYHYLWELGYEDIDVDMKPHHLIFGELKDIDAYNWTKKAQVAVKKAGYDFPRYSGSFDAFYDDFMAFFNHPGRFTYTPLLCCRGRKPENA